MCPFLCRFFSQNYEYLLFSRALFVVHMSVCGPGEKERRGYLFGLISYVKSGLLISPSLKNLIISQLLMNLKRYAMLLLKLWLHCLNTVCLRIQFKKRYEFLFWKIYTSCIDSSQRVMGDCCGNRPKRKAKQ